MADANDYDDIYCSHLGLLKLKAIDSFINDQVKETILAAGKSKFLDYLAQALQKIGRAIKCRQNEMNKAFTEFMTSLRMTEERSRWEKTRQQSVQWPILCHALWDALLSELNVVSKRSMKRNNAHITLEKLEPFITSNSITKTLFTRNKEEVKRINKSIENESLKTDLEITLNNMYKMRLHEFANRNDKLAVAENVSDFEINEFIQRKLQPLQTEIDELNRTLTDKHNLLVEKTERIARYVEIQDKYTNERKKMLEMGNRITENVTKTIKPDIEEMSEQIESLKLTLSNQIRESKEEILKHYTIPSIYLPSNNLSRSSTHMPFHHSSTFMSGSTDLPGHLHHSPVENSASFNTGSRSSVHPSPTENSDRSSGLSSQQYYNGSTSQYTIEGPVSGLTTQNTFWVEPSLGTLTGVVIPQQQYHSTTSDTSEPPSSLSFPSQEFPADKSSPTSPIPPHNNKTGGSVSNGHPSPLHRAYSFSPELPSIHKIDENMVVDGGGHSLDTGLTIPVPMSARPYKSPRSRSSSSKNQKQKQRRNSTPLE